MKFPPLGMMLYFKLLCSKTEMMLWCCRFTNKSCVKRELAFLLYSVHLWVYTSQGLSVYHYMFSEAAHPHSHARRWIDTWLSLFWPTGPFSYICSRIFFFFVECGWVYPCEISFALYSDWNVWYQLKSGCYSVGARAKEISYYVSAIFFNTTYVRYCSTLFCVHSFMY